MPKFKMRRMYFPIAMLFVVLTLSIPVFAADYEEVDLGQSAWSGDLRAINNLNQAVGSKKVGDKTIPVLWQDGVLTELESIPSNPEIALYYKYNPANDINDSGNIIISAHTQATGGVHATALLINGQMTQLPLNAVGSINNSGQIVGTSGPLGTIQAELWDNGIITELGIYENGRSSYGANSNNVGQIIGSSTMENGGLARVISWENGQMIPLPHLSEINTYSYATDVNDSGIIVGASRDDQNITRPVMWKNGEIIPLGSLEGGSGAGFATAINNSGQITGYAHAADNAYHAFIWENGIMTDLGNIGSLAGHPSYGLDINEAGYVVGGIGGIGAWPTIAADAPFILAPVCHADVNNDNIVDIKDLEEKQLELQDWLQSQGECNMELISGKLQELQSWITTCWNPGTTCP